MKEIRDEFSRMGGGSVTLDFLEGGGGGGGGGGGLARLTLSNPGKRNALSGRMMAELHRRLEEELEAWAWGEEERAGGRGKALLVCAADDEAEAAEKGERKVVCSGGDLEVVKAILTPEQGEWRTEKLSPPSRRDSGSFSRQKKNTKKHRDFKV